ncbi:MAG: fibronectin-binding domain-containing protein, partial [Candidatus Altiarchaeales archaeon]|nr:fibronectin-binding domain-containing protein [Candidatus Altiarchaeales archaeon]
MKKSLSSVDLHFLLREWGGVLVGARFDKAYQLGERDVLLRFHSPGVGRVDFIVTPSFACCSSHRWQAPQTPSSFAMQLRKNLSQGYVRGLSQAGFDRIFEIKIHSKKGVFHLVFELFSKGNVFLLDDERN